jgi:DNA modification methylase
MNLTELYSKADYQDEIGMLFHMDCMNLLKEIDDNCVDLCITDPPLWNEFSIA